MKTKLLGMFGAAGLLLAATSCSDDLSFNEGGQNGDLVQVTFTIAKESGVSTRSATGNNGGYVYYPEGDDEYPQISDGSKAKRLVWAVYDADGNLLPELGNNYESNSKSDETPGFGQVVEDVKNFPHTITLSLVRGQTYSFAFWAQDENCTAYNTQDLRAVTIDYKSPENNRANDELRDAFCKVETFTVSSAASMSRDIILRRPFAQVNVGIPAAEYEALRQSGVRIKESMIHFENVATEFDVVANSTHGNDKTKTQAIDYSANLIPAYYNWKIDNDLQIPTDKDLQDGRTPHGPTQDLKIDLNKDGEIAPYGQKNGDGADASDETFNYMLMAYILPADRNDGTSTYSTTLDKVSFSLIPEDSGQQPLTMDLENVPVQRNWRTNIFGRMFTSQVSLRIDLDPFYAGDYNYPSWERIYEGVYYETVINASTRDDSENESDNQEYVIHISNGAGLIWLSNATNGVWPTKKAFEDDDTHNKASNLQNSADLMIKAANLEEWPEDGLFNFKDVTIKLDADIDLDAYASIFGKEGEEFYFTPIGFGGNDEYNDALRNKGKYFSGHFDGQNHTIYNLKTARPQDGNDLSSMGLFGVIGREASIRNVRLKNVDIFGHYRVGGIVGQVYGPIYRESEIPVIIDNCYVDSGTIVATTNNDGGNGKDVAGICGIMYNNGTISNCSVRNVIIRGYRTIGGIVGQTGGDYANEQYILSNSVYDVTLIADWFQYKDQGKSDYEIENIFIGESFWPTQLDNNKEGNNKIYAFWWTKEGDRKITNVGLDEKLSNPPLDIFPRMAYFTDEVRFQTSIMGGPSAYKKYSDDEEPYYKGKADEKSGRVGLWVSNLTLIGERNAEGSQYLDYPTITASGLGTDENGKDAVLYIKDAAEIKYLTFHSSNYASQAICLAPANGETITLDNVLAYDARKVLTDDGDGAGGKLKVKDSNFRGYVKLSQGYQEITFTGTTFDGSTKRADKTTNKVDIPGEVTFDGCSFLVEAGNNYIIEAPQGKFKNCKAYVVGNPEGIDITGSCIISVGDDGNPEIK